MSIHSRIDKEPTSVHGHESFVNGPARFQRRTMKDMDGAVMPEELCDQCSYCGSISIEDMLRAFETPGVAYSGSDWKYGYPHKFYIDFPCEPFPCVISATSVIDNDRGGERRTAYAHGTRRSRNYKFYIDHMQEATDEQIARWNRIVMPRLGIELARENGRINYWAPRFGHQAYGHIVG